LNLGCHAWHKERQLTNEVSLITAHHAELIDRVIPESTNSSSTLAKIDVISITLTFRLSYSVWPFWNIYSLDYSLTDTQIDENTGLGHDNRYPPTRHNLVQRADRGDNALRPSG
jgi:hypothetical protein